MRPLSKGVTDTYWDTFIGPDCNPCYPEGGFMVPSGSFGFSVLVYTLLALFAVVFLIFRRKTGGGELGGPTKTGNTIGSLVMASLWVAYIVLSIVGRK